VLDRPVAAPAAEEAAEVIESLPVRVHLRLVAQMPFPQSEGLVAGLLHRLGVGDDLAVHAVLPVRAVAFEAETLLVSAR